MVNYQNLTRNLAWTQFQGSRFKRRGYWSRLSVRFGCLLGVGADNGARLLCLGTWLWDRRRRWEVTLFKNGLKKQILCFAYCSCHWRWHRITSVAPHRNRWKYATWYSVRYRQPHDKGTDHLFRREGHSIRLCKWQRAMSHNVNQR